MIWGFQCMSKRLIRADGQSCFTTASAPPHLNKETRKSLISVLHVVLSTVTGGMENVIYNLATGFDKSRFKLSVGCLVELGHLSDRLREFDIESEVVPGMIPGLSLIYPGQLIKFIRQSGCDIVHTHSGCWAKVAAACAFIRKVKLIYTEHGRTFPEPKVNILQDRISARFTNRIVAVGDPLNRYLIDRVGLHPEKVVTIRNGIDTERFKSSDERESVRREFGFTDNDVVIVIVARLAPVKNHSFLIDTFHTVSSIFPQARLLIIGDGPLRSQLENQAVSLKLTDKVVFTGDRHDVPRLLAAADIATLCSHSEGISLTLLEAMSSQLAAVATDVGGNPDIVTHGENGYIVKLNDKSDYADKLSKLIHSGDLREKFGIKARNEVVASWSLKGMVDAYQRLYQELAG
ncbi:MAG: glycosyltransferase [candidate division Zixibacteria bacterium]|nr:glycosyltransferase [candidate division Zixibacteria bacterium]